jgi:glycosyltransferase involved in cell wall biosynthesis
LFAKLLKTEKMKVLHLYPATCEYAYPKYLDQSLDPDAFDQEILCNTDLEVRYLKGLTELGVNCVFVYPRRFRLPSKEFTHRGGYRMVRVPVEFFEGHIGIELPFTMHNVILREKPDLVHMHGVFLAGSRFFNPDFFDLTAAFCRRHAIPFFGWHHVGEFPLGSRLPVLWLARKFSKMRAIRSCAGITSINHMGLQRLFDPAFPGYYGLDFSTVPHLHTPNTYDPSVFYPIPRLEARRRCGLDPNAHYILMVSRLFYEKGLHFLLEIMPEILHRHPEARLLVIGDFIQGAEAYHQKINRMMRDLGLEQRVTILPRVEHHQGLVDFYNSADVFVLPTLRESFGAVNIEAMACGIPVISTDREEIPYYLTPATGLLVKEHDQHALLEAVDTVLSGRFHPDEARRKQILARYSYKEAAARLKEWYEEILATHDSH